MFFVCIGCGIREGTIINKKETPAETRTCPGCNGARIKYDLIQEMLIPCPDCNSTGEIHYPAAYWIQLKDKEGNTQWFRVSPSTYKNSDIGDYRK